MNFVIIHNNVVRYIDKQQAAMTANPNVINMTIKRLDQYVARFHDEMSEMLQAEGITVLPDLINQLQKPSVQMVDSERSQHSDNIRERLVNLSKELIDTLKPENRNDLLDYWSWDEVRRHKDYVRVMIRNTIGGIDVLGTYLNKVFGGIDYEWKYWTRGRPALKLETLYREIRSPLVINEFKAQGGRDIAAFVNPYRTYLVTCLQEYERIYVEAQSVTGSIVTKEQTTSESPRVALTVAAEEKLMEDLIQEQSVILREADLEEQVEDLNAEEKRQLFIEDLTSLSVKCTNGSMIEFDLKLASADFQNELLRLVSLHNSGHSE